MDRDAKLIFENYKKSILNELAPTAALPTLAGPTLAGTATTTGAGAAGLMTGPLGWTALVATIIGSVALYKFLENRKYTTQKEESKRQDEAFNKITEILSNQLNATYNTIEETLNAFASMLRSIGDVYPPLAVILERPSYYFKTLENIDLPDVASMQQGFNSIIATIDKLIQNVEKNKAEIIKNSNNLINETIFASTISEIKSVVRYSEATFREFVGTTSADVILIQQQLQSSTGGGGLPPTPPKKYGGYNQPFDPNDPLDREKLKQEQEKTKQAQGKTRDEAIERARRIRENKLYYKVLRKTGNFLLGDKGVGPVAVKIIMLLFILGGPQYATGFLLGTTLEGLVPMAIRKYGEYKRGENQSAVDGYDF